MTVELNATWPDQTFSIYRDSFQLKKKNTSCALDSVFTTPYIHTEGIVRLCVATLHLQDKNIQSRPPSLPLRRRRPGLSIIKLSVPHGRECTAVKGN